MWNKGTQFLTKVLFSYKKIDSKRLHNRFSLRKIWFINLVSRMNPYLELLNVGSSLSRSTCKLGWRRNMQSRKPLPIYSFLRRLFCPTWLIVNFGGLCLVLSLFSSGAARCRVYGRGGSKQPFKDVLDLFLDRNYHFYLKVHLFLELFLCSKTSFYWIEPKNNTNGFEIIRGFKVFWTSRKVVWVFCSHSMNLTMNFIKPFLPIFVEIEISRKIVIIEIQPIWK